MSAQEELFAIYSHFGESYSDLTSMVKDSQRSYDGLVERNKELSAKFDPASAAPSMVGTSEDDDASLVYINLSAEDVDLIRETLQWRVKTITKYPKILLDMALIYLLALFDAFLKDSFACVLVHRPEMLRTKKQMTHDAIVRLGSMDQVIRSMAQQEIHELSYKSTRDQWQYLAERFGLRLSDEDLSDALLQEMNAQRNLLVHNNGVANETYLRSLDAPRLKLGERVQLTVPEWTELAEHIYKIASLVYRRCKAILPVPEGGDTGEGP